MTDFDKKLNVALHKHIDSKGIKIYYIAQQLGIAPQTLYNFTSGKSSLNGENTARLLNYLGLTVELKEDK